MNPYTMNFIYPSRQTARTPEQRRPPGCPEFDANTVGNRPPNAQGKPRGVAPGLHGPELGDHRVVWWDPSILKLDAGETMGLRQVKLLQADAKNERSERGRLEYAAWHEARAAQLAKGAAPTMRVATATELAAAKPLPDYPEAVQPNRSCDVCGSYFFPGSRGSVRILLNLSRPMQRWTLSQLAMLWDSKSTSPTLILESRHFPSIVIASYSETTKQQ